VMQIKNNYRMKWQNINNLETEGEGVFQRRPGHYCEHRQ
jgi:hypothetical protein